MKFEENRFTYLDTAIAAYRSGSGRPLIVLHGWGSEAKVMMPLAEKLSAIRECHLLDFPGFGNSDEPKNGWELTDFSGMVKTYIRDQFADDQTVDLLVHSYGCRVTLLLCTDPEISGRIGKVLVTGGAGLKPKRSLQFYLKKYTGKLLKLPFIFLPGSLRERGLNRLRQTSLWKMLGSSDYRKLSGPMRETFVKTVTHHLDDKLKEIDHEILLLWGENDDATPLDQARRLEKGLKNSALVKIDNAGHYAFLDQPARFTAIAKAFFEG